MRRAMLLPASMAAKKRASRRSRAQARAAYAQSDLLSTHLRRLPLAARSAASAVSDFEDRGPVHADCS